MIQLLICNFRIYDVILILRSAKSILSADAWKLQNMICVQTNMPGGLPLFWGENLKNHIIICAHKEGESGPGQKHKKKLLQNEEARREAKAKMALGQKLHCS